MAWLARTDAAAPAGDADPEDHPAEHEQLERFFAHLGELLEDIDFNKGRSTETLMRRLRRLFLRAAPSRREIRILRGIFSEAQRAARQGAGHAAGGGLG
jgi:tRNA (cytidine32/uridine32-2'-O)-methyltransferase